MKTKTIKYLLLGLLGLFLFIKFIKVFFIIALIGALVYAGAKYLKK